MDTLACYPVCHPARPKQIGSGNRRLGNPSPINRRPDLGSLLIKTIELGPPPAGLPVSAPNANPKRKITVAESDDTPLSLL